MPAAPPPAADPVAAAAPEAPAPAPPAEAVAAPAPTYPMTTIGGYVEGGWHHGLVEHSNSYGQLPTRVYDAGNGFQLHAMHLAIHSALNEHIGAFIDIDAGSDAAVNNGSGGTPARTLFDIQEAYAVLSASGFTLSAGKFATYEGIELIEGPTNPTLTRGFLYAFAEPITHVGAKLHYTQAMFDLGVGLVNGWDTNGPPGTAANGGLPTGLWTSDNNNNKTFIWRAAVTPAPIFFAAFSGTYGVEKPGQDTDPRLSLDLTGAVVPADMITLNFQGNYGSEKKAAPDGGTASWWGLGLQPVLKIDAATIGARLEYFKDSNGVRVPASALSKTGYLNATITPGYTFYGAFTMRAEFRYDHATESVLANAAKGQTSIGNGAHYVF